MRPVEDSQPLDDRAFARRHLLGNHAAPVVADKAKTWRDKFARDAHYVISERVERIGAEALGFSDPP